MLVLMKAVWLMSVSLKTVGVASVSGCFIKEGMAYAPLSQVLKKEVWPKHLSV